MSRKINIWEKSKWPERLLEINDPPECLYIRGKEPPKDHIYICIVGSRKYSPYGKLACEHIIKGLAGLPVVIVSGLALGIDSIAHKAALENNIQTIGFPGSGISDEVIYPRTNINIAYNILKSDSCIISEFNPNEKAMPWFFPKRNRIMAGISHMTIIIEAEEKSGTLITARLALDYNREIGIIPGSIFNKSSYGPLSLLKEGAHPIISAQDICHILGIKKESYTLPKNLSEEEIEILSHLKYPQDKNKLLEEVDLPIHLIQSTLMNLELKGIIKESEGLICQNF